MKKILATLTVCFALAAPNALFAASEGDAAEAPKKDIVDTAVGAGSFNTLVAAVQAADLVETLKGKGPFTVFAPTDKAFAKLPKGTVEELLKPENKKKLQTILLYHVAPGKLPAEKVIKMSVIPTAAKQSLAVVVTEKGDVMIDEAKVVKPNIMTSNGVIHVIDTVILPANADIVDTAVAAKFNTLVAAVKAAGLVETLKGKGPFTVFAPTDEAFAALPEGTVANLLKPENKDQLVKILTYHVVPGKVPAAKVIQSKELKTVAGQPLKVSVSDDGVKVDNAKVVKADIKTTNGIIHVIDAVVLPK